MRLTKVAGKTIAAWKRHMRYISSCGGTRSSKTFSILQTAEAIETSVKKSGDVLKAVLVNDVTE